MTRDQRRDAIDPFRRFCGGLPCQGGCGVVRCRILRVLVLVHVGISVTKGVRVLTCEWYSTECALLSSHRTPAPPALIMNPVLVVANWRLRCHGKL